MERKLCVPRGGLPQPKCVPLPGAPHQEPRAHTPCTHLQSLGIPELRQEGPTRCEAKAESSLQTKAMGCPFLLSEKARGSPPSSPLLPSPTLSTWYAKLEEWVLSLLSVLLSTGSFHALPAHLLIRLLRVLSMLHTACYSSPSPTAASENCPLQLGPSSSSPAFQKNQQSCPTSQGQPGTCRHTA